MDEVLQLLGYQESTNFIRSGSDDFVSAADHAHILRKAERECGLKGVYVLRPDNHSCRGLVPVVYVCAAKDELAADLIHRQVWNQNVVPFLLVVTPKFARLYAGFRHSDGCPERGVLQAAVTFNEVADKLDSFHANAIDAGQIWQKWGKFVTPETRVDWQLLDRLRRLDNLLQSEGLDRGASHALIGKFVYLRYLHDRDILSDRKLDKWQIRPESLFTRQITPTSFWAVDERLNKELNGAVFPLAPKKSAIKPEHLQKVAGVFFGDDPDGQLHLDFQAYNFSFIPTELLSSIYEQFLHSPTPGENETPGKQAGAYYTPVPLVNFILNELDEKKPLTEGMRVLDPACGSGAFLVQAYRRLIELKIAKSGVKKLKLTELRQLLTEHIFGVERDADACQVAELSLILTLLDFVEPPDLESCPQFRLPTLRDANIFKADFFDPKSVFESSCRDIRFDWVVGNPPWKKANSTKRDDLHCLRWIQENGELCPVGGNQLAEAFAWKAAHHTSIDGVAGLVLPAMTLFKGESTAFRHALFSRTSVWCVANFANMAFVLFAGRASRAAAVFFYSPRSPSPDDFVLTYAPFVVNQEANRPSVVGKQQATWSIVVNADELRDVPIGEVASGAMLPWKIAMWGSRRDQKLLTRLEGRFPSLEAFCRSFGLVVHQGFELRQKTQKDCGVYQPDLVGKRGLDVSKLRQCDKIFCFPADALTSIAQEDAFCRINRGKPGLAVSQPPHVVVDASRRFAVYSSDFIAVPQRLIGVAGRPGSESLLKALSLYLSSDFAVYHQFFMSPEWGIDTNRATLHALKALPVALGELNSANLAEWEALHEMLVSASKAEQDGRLSRNDLVPDKSVGIQKLNELVFDLVGIRPSERRIISDFVNEKMHLLHGKVTEKAVKKATKSEVRTYLNVLKEQLDGFIVGSGKVHNITAVPSDRVGAVHIRVAGSNADRDIEVLSPSAETSRVLNQLEGRFRQRHSQWLYFDRNLRLYDGPSTYLFKPMHRLHWTTTQGMLDADAVIAETLTTAQDEGR